MAAVGKGVWQLSRGEKSQLGAPADCHNFPSQFLLDIGRAQFDDIILLSCYLFFHLEASPEGVLPSAQNSPWEAQAGGLKGLL